MEINQKSENLLRCLIDTKYKVSKWQTPKLRLLTSTSCFSEHHQSSRPTAEIGGHLDSQPVQYRKKIGLREALVIDICGTAALVD